jgi:sortase A
MIGGGLAIIGFLAWSGYIKPLRIQAEARAEFKAFTPTAKAEEPTSTPHSTATSVPIAPTISPTPLPRSPTPTPEPADFLLEVPAIELEWVVHEIIEPDLNDPWRIPKAELDKYGVVRFPEMAFPGQPGVTAIAGHRDASGSPFLWLDKLKIGDEIQITLQDGTVISYKIFDKKYIDPLNLQVLDPQLEGEQELRLVTCLFGSIRKRLIISAQHIEKGGS